MRKHDVRKWLHAILDLLPVILIPVFMIYSHRHTIDSGSIQVQEKILVDFNQMAIYRDDINVNGVQVTNNEQNISVNGTLNTAVSYNQFYVTRNMIFHRDESKYYVRFSGNQGWSIGIAGYSAQVNSFIFSASASSDWDGFLYIRLNVGETINIDNLYLNVYDLTQMFGRGNEPTVQEFESLYPLNYYPYVVSDKQLIDGDLVTYNDTDIMSQFTYQLYNSVDKYFNMGNVFHLNEVYDWFNLNIFNGQAPIYIFIVYQIVLYELIMDLLMLLYALFMWFIDMIEKLMEKPLNSVK